MISTRTFASSFFAAVSAFALCAGTSDADDGIGIVPATVTLSAGRMADGITLTNHSATPTIMQVRVVVWTRSGDADFFEATRELIASPPIFTMPAGGAQLVRVGLRAPLGLDTERSYRVFIKQVVPEHAGLTFASQFSIPVFVEPAGAVVHSLHWSASTDGGRTTVSVTNGGRAHELLRQITVSANGETLLDRVVAQYLMPNATTVFRLPERAPRNAPLIVDATTAAAPVHVVLGP